MTTPNTPSEPSLQVRTPCPKRWEELVGGDVQRFCSECSLHVIDGSRLTRDEAHARVANATERVCMRLAFDANGRAIHADTPAATRSSRKWTARVSRWAVLTTAALVAACHRDGAASVTGSPSSTASGEPGGTSACTTILGKVAVAQHVMGDVAVNPMPAATPATTTPAAPVAGAADDGDTVELGEVWVPPSPPTPR